jgi:hypothetical protein
MSNPLSNPDTLNLNPDWPEDLTDPLNSAPEDFEDPVDEEELWTCCYPDKCLMPGAHTRSECHTVEDAEAYEREMLRQDSYFDDPLRGTSKC